MPIMRTFINFYIFLSSYASADWPLYIWILAPSLSRSYAKLTINMTNNISASKQKNVYFLRPKNIIVALNLFFWGSTADEQIMHMASKQAHQYIIIHCVNACQLPDVWSSYGIDRVSSVHALSCASLFTVRMTIKLWETMCDLIISYKTRPF